MQPVNLAVRFLLELMALFVLGWWGWRQRSDGWRIVLVVAIPLLAAAVWGTFNVPNDPSRSGAAPVPVAGILRLAIELAFFGAGAWALYDLKFTLQAALFASVVVLHYMVSVDRIRWLVAQ
jgi:hypothetical protein